MLKQTAALLSKQNETLAAEAATAASNAAAAAAKIRDASRSRALCHQRDV